MRDPFYYGTTKKLLVAFCSIFDEIAIIDDFGRRIEVPLNFTQREKFLDDPGRQADYDMDALTYDITFPKMGVEIAGFNFAPERNLNPLRRIPDFDQVNKEEVMMYNRIPYDLTFNLFIGSRKLEDSLKIVEQILPFFSPELTLTIKDKENFGLETNIPVELNSTSLNIDALGSLDNKRVIMWTLNFTMKAFYYSDVRQETRIKQTIIDFAEMDLDAIMERYTATVNPLDAEKTDPHTVIETTQMGVDDD